MKKKLPTFEELFSRFLEQIKNREPEKELTSDIINHLREKWLPEPIGNFYLSVLKLEQNALKVTDIIKKQEMYVNEFQIGYSISGEPIIHTHFINRKMTTKDSKRYSKKGTKVIDEVSTMYSPVNLLF